MQTFGEQLIAARKAKGMTQDALANAAAVTRQTISSWERGRTVPDIDTIRRLSDILGTDLVRAAEGPGPAPAMEPLAEGRTPPMANDRRIKRWWIIAGAAVLVCVILSAVLWAPHRGAPAGGGDAFNAEVYRQETPNEAGKAYLTFDSKLWDEAGDNVEYQRYVITMYEQNGVGFSVSRAELQFEGKTGTVRSAVLNANDLRVSGVDPDILPYGSLPIDGGFPKGEFKRAGIAVYGNDANGTPLTFYSLVEF